jgi:hypothetical protein
MIPEDPLGSSYTAKAKAVDRVFDAASDTFSARLGLANPNYGLPIGLRCKVIFPVKYRKGQAGDLPAR